ncbi:MAG: M16 family metallopeptidase [Terriglobales bacterium]
MPKDLPPFGPEKPLQAPSVKVAKLANGMTVWLVAEPGFPKVAYTLGVRGGLAADPTDRPGISELLSKTIDQGTRTRSAKQIAEEFQSAGGDISVDSTKDAIQVSATVLSSKAETALTVLADIVQNATFPDAEVTLAKRNLSDSLRQRESEPSFLAARAMARVLFGDHPYHVVAPTQESIAASTSTDLRNVYAQRFRPDQAVLIAVGDFTDNRMLELAQAKLGAWKNPDGPALQPVARPATASEHAIFFVARPDSVQTTLELATFGPLRSDPDYEAAEVANAIYGGTFSSRLVANIREDKGYTYSPFASLNTYRDASALVTRADVRNEVTGPSLNEINYELNRMATTSPTDEELAKAKRFLVGTEAIQLQARAGVTYELAKLWVDGLPPEEIGIYGQKVSSMTRAEVDAAARKYFPAAAESIVAVGEEKVVRDSLAVFGMPIRSVP